MSTRIAIDPTDLRRGATRIRDGAAEVSLAAHSLQSAALPEMPAGVAGEVQAGIAAAATRLQSLAPILNEDAVELERRALWAEIADQLASGRELDGSQLREFLAWMKDGSLLRYADVDQAEAAGSYIGAMYRDRFEDPEELFDLAQILHASQQSSRGDELDAFSAAFVEGFGAENLVEVPRVIQAVEWSNVIGSGMVMTTDPHILQRIAYEWAGRDLEHDPVGDLLAPFALALANATYSGRLSRTVEDEIAHDEDTWATAQLLHTGVFGTRFLLECFRTGVVDTIVESSRYDSAGALAPDPQSDPYALGRYWSDGEDGLAFDPKELVLGALARNREAAVAALTTPLEGVEPWDQFGQQHEVTNPVRLLFDYGDFQDDGAAFGRAYNAAADELFADPRDTDAVDKGNLLTLDVLDRVVNGDRDLDGVTDALARDLGDHHLEALYYQAAAEHPTDLDGGRAGYVDTSEDHRIHLSRQELVDVLAAITDRDEAGRAFLGDAARYQAATILVGTETAPDFDGDFSWAHRAGSFNELLLEAGDVNRVEDFEEADAQAKMIVGFVNDVVSLAKLPPGVGIVVDHGVDALGASLAPSEEELVRDSNRAHAILENGLTASIVQGYADNGLIDLRGAEELGLVEDDRLVPYNELDGIARGRFEEWMNNDPDVSRVIREAIQEANR